MSPAEVLEHWQRRKDDAEQLDSQARVATVIDAFLVDLEQLQSEPDQMLTVAEAAQRLGVQPRWIYERSKDLPFITRIGTQVRCSNKDLARYVEMRGNG